MFQRDEPPSRRPLTSSQRHHTRGVFRDPFDHLEEHDVVERCTARQKTRVERTTIGRTWLVLFTSDRHDHGVRAIVLVVSCAIAATSCTPPADGDVPPPAPSACLDDGNGPVDVMLVMDNSESLDPITRNRLTASLNVFLAPLLASELDYHVGVITSDPAEGGILRAFDGPPVEGCVGCRFLTREVGCGDITVDVDGLTIEERDAALAESCEAWLVVARLLRAGEEGGANEQSFDMAVAALDDGAPAENDGFRRAEAPLHIVFISDEEEGDKEDGSPVRHYERIFKGLAGRGNEALVTTSSIAGMPPEMDEAKRAELCPILLSVFDDDATNDDPRAGDVRARLADFRRGCSSGGDSEQAEVSGRYIELACRSGGLATDLCAADYAPAMAALGAHVIERCVEGECIANTNCEPGDMCNATTSSCVEGVQCLRDGHCDVGAICEGASCEAGCRDDADCALDLGCIGASLGGGVGVCGVACTDASLCAFGELCVAGECVVDPRGVCEPCSASCEAPDSCRIDVTGFSFCAIDCFGGQECPRGFSCQDIVIVPPSAPFCTLPETCESGACSRNTATSCVVDEDCPEGPPGGDCSIQNGGRFGNCALDADTACRADGDCAAGDTCVLIECRATANGDFGFCTCSRDSDCPVDICIGADLSDPANPVMGHCELAGHDCFESFECDVITCVDGGCLLGRSCDLPNGVPCPQIVVD
jgi:hypothetical protein